jgi:hypothetical protein
VEKENIQAVTLTKPNFWKIFRKIVKKTGVWD